METFITGYCRVLDSARTVMADTEDAEADCAYPDCVYAPSCPIAKQLKEYLSQT